MKRLHGIKSLIGRNLTNAQGAGVNRKIVVFESDDWGSIRMPHSDIYQRYKELGFDLDSCPYSQYDTLASAEDLDALFETLNGYKDIHGNHPKFTFNTVMANPLFEKIRASEYTEYFYEPFPETLGRYYPNEKVFDLWKQGIEEKLIQPQFHGREHVNVLSWLSLLRVGNEPLLKAFELGFWGIPKSFYGSDRINIQAAFGGVSLQDLEFSANNLREGLQLFEELFGFKSKTFIPNNYTFPEELQSVLLNAGVVGIQGMKKQKIPQQNGGIVTRNIYTGKRNQWQQIYTVRNAIFEPSQMPENFNNIEHCLNEINNSFFWKKPAIITSHRLNYIGTLNKENRTRNLKMLGILFDNILKRWPDVEFLSSDELIEIIN